VPRRYGVTPAGIEPALPRVRAGSSPLSYGVRAWPAGIEPATPRVSGGRSTGLSYGHIEVGEAGIEPAASCL
jgi:hypothetical protein